MATVTYNNVFENQFWLQILGDSSRILLLALLPLASNEVQQTQALITQFDSLLERARQNLTPEQLAQLNQEAFNDSKIPSTNFLCIY